jgi:hypothetical protein
MKIFKVLTVALFAFTSGFTASESDTWKNYQAILNSITTSLKFTSVHGDFDQTAVNYDKLKSDATLQSLMQSQIKTLSEISVPITQKEAKVFWLNAYNFFTLVDMSNNWPLESMKDIGWKNERHNVEGKNYSLDQIEHEIIRPYGDARIHFAVNCASVGCPSLSKKIFTTRHVEKQLTEASKNALKNPLHLVVQKNGDILGTKLFEWFEDDFGGEEGVLKFISKYGPAKATSYSDFSYDWRVNNKENFDLKYQEIFSDYPHLKIKTK